MTTPPCNEQVQYFVVADVLPLGSTVLDMFRDSINVRIKMEHSVNTLEIIDAERPILDGNYRDV